MLSRSSLSITKRTRNKAMANFFTDNTDLKHHLNHPMMRRIVELKERNFADADKFDYAPHDF